MISRGRVGIYVEKAGGFLLEKLGFLEEKPIAAHTLGQKARIFPVPEGFLRKASDLYGKSWWISRGRPKIYMGKASGFLEKGLGFIEESRRSSRGNPKVYVGKAGGFLEEKATAPHTPHTPTPYDFSRKASDLCRESLRIFKRKARISLEKAGASRHPG